MVDVPLPAVMGDVAVTVDKDAETDPTFTTTLAVCVIATELIVAETDLMPAAVALSVRVATPLASVFPTGCVNVLPAVGPTRRSSDLPWTGFPFASRAVTVMVDVPLPAVMGDVAVTVDKDADTVPAFTTTLAVWVIATELIVAETVLVPAAVEVSVPVATRLGSGVVTGWVSGVRAVGVRA